jgi:hypothetical protein
MDGLMFLLIALIGVLLVVEVVERIGHRRDPNKYKPTIKEKPSSPPPTETGELTEPEDIQPWRENRTERGIRLPKSKRSRR